MARVLGTGRQQPASSQPTLPLTGTQPCLKSASQADLLQTGAVPEFERGTGRIPPQPHSLEVPERSSRREFPREAAFESIFERLLWKSAFKGSIHVIGGRKTPAIDLRTHQHCANW